MPRDADAEISLAGRSNVGKSSLINALTRKRIARTSAAPGKTRLANIYRVTLESGGTGRRDVYLVDLPGYGYARGGADSADELGAVAEAYFAGGRPRPARGAKTPSAQTGRQRERNTRSPVLALLLVDSRHPGLDADRRALDWLSRHGAAAVHVVATKVDKLSRAERARNLREFERVLGLAPLAVSAATGEGLDQLWKLMVGHAGMRNTPEPGKSDETEEQR